MMNDIGLFIQDENNNYKQIDLHNDEGISIVDSIKDVKDISKIFNTFSREFLIPASPKNNRIFKHYQNHNINNGYDGRLKTKALIKISGGDYKEGYLRLLDAVVKNNEVVNYKISFEGLIKSIKDVFDGDKISDLSFETLVFKNDAVNRVLGIRDGLFIGGVDGAQGVAELDSNGFALYPDVIFAPIFSGGKVVPLPYQEGDDWSGGDVPVDNNYDFSLVKFTGQGNSNTSTVANNTNGTQNTPYQQLPITPFDFQPAVKVGRVLDMIQETYPAINFQDSFVHKEEIDQLYMLFNGKLKDSDIDNSNNAFNVNPSSTKSVEVIDEERVVYTTETVPSNPLGISMTPTGSVSKTPMTDINDVFKTGGRVYVSINNSEETISIIMRKFYIDVNTGDRVLLNEREEDVPNTGSSFYMDGLFSPLVPDLTGGEDVEFEFEVISSGSLNLGLTVSFDYIQFVLGGTQNNVWAYNSVTPTSFAYVPFQKVSPDIKLIDFLTGIFKMNNMTAYVEGDEIVVRTLAEYYSAGKTYNIENYVDTKTNVVSAAFDYNNVLMKYEDASDVLAKNYVNRTSGLKFGEIKVNKDTFVQDDFINATEVIDDGDDFEVKLPFGRMMFERLALCFNSSQGLTGGATGGKYTETDGGLPTDMVIGNQIDDDLKGVDTKPLLFFGKQVDTTRAFSINPSPDNVGDLSGFIKQDTSIERGNTAGYSGASIGGDRNLVLTTNVSDESSSTLGLTTIGLFPGGATDKHKWWNPSGIMASRKRRDGSFVRPTGFVNGLSFNNIDSDEYEYNIGLQTDKWIGGLYQTNYEEYLSGIYSKKARLSKFDIVFPQSLLKRYALNDTYIIGTNEYYINKIDVELFTGKGKIQLINKIPYTYSVPTNNPPTIPLNMRLVGPTATTVTTTAYSLTSNPSIDEEGEAIEYLYNKNNVDLVWSSSLNTSVTGGTAGQVDDWKIKARDIALNESDWSPISKFGTRCDAPTITHNPTLSTNTQLAFVANSVGAVDYRVSYKESSSTVWIKYTGLVDELGGFILSGLNPDTSYDIQCSASNVNSLYGSYGTLTVSTALPTPTDLTAFVINLTAQTSFYVACGLEVGTTIYFHDGDSDLPESGDTVYTQNDLAFPFAGQSIYYKCTAGSNSQSTQIQGNGTVVTVIPCGKN